MSKAGTQILSLTGLRDHGVEEALGRRAGVGEVGDLVAKTNGHAY